MSNSTSTRIFYKHLFAISNRISIVYTIPCDALLIIDVTSFHVRSLSLSCPVWTLVTSAPLDVTLARYRSQTTGTSHEFSVFHPDWPAGRWEQHVRTIINIYIVLHLHNKSINESEFLQKAAALQLPVVQSRWKHFCVCPLRDTNAGCNWIRQEHGAHRDTMNFSWLHGD